MFEEYLKCERLEHGFFRLRCDSYHAEHLVALSCKKRGFCPSCGARRMAEIAALLEFRVMDRPPKLGEASSRRAITVIAASNLDAP